MILNAIKALLGGQSDKIQLQNGKLYKSSSKLVLDKCTLFIKQLSQYQYQLICTNDDELDEYAFLIHMDMCFEKTSTSFKWKDSDNSEYEYIFDAQATTKHTIDFFETSVLECIYEQTFNKSREEATAKDLEDLKNHKEPVGKEFNEIKSDLNIEGDVVATCTADLHIYDTQTMNFVLLPDGLGVTGQIVDQGKFKFIFSVRNKQKVFLSQPLDNSMNPVFSDAHQSFIWNYHDESIDLSYSWSLRFTDVKLFNEFRKVFGRCMYESLNEELFQKVKEEDQSYLVDAYADDVEMSDAVHESDESEDEFHDTETDKSPSKFQKIPNSNEEEKNRLLAVGFKNNRSFVFRGDKIGVFSHTNHDLEFSTTINAVQSPKGKLLTPRKVMLHNQDSNMVLLDPSTPSSLYKMDLEVGKVVEEWKVDENRDLIDMTPDSKYAQMTPQQTFVGLSHNALFRVDPRLSGSKLVQTQLNQYKSKNAFSCTSTTGKGDLIVASSKGDLRLYNQIDKRAKTHLPGLGDPIIGIDVTEDGKFILATCKNYLLLMNTTTDGASVDSFSGFTKSMGSKKPVPKRLQLKPEHVAWINEPISFTPAKFNTGADLEKRIVTSTGPYVITWNFRRVKAGHKYDYTIKKYPDRVVADQFEYGNDSKVVVTLPDDVTLTTRFSQLTQSELSSLRKICNSASNPNDIDWFSLEQHFPQRTALELKFAHEKLLQDENIESIEEKIEFTPEIDKKLYDIYRQKLHREFIIERLEKINPRLTIDMYRSRIKKIRVSLNNDDLARIKDLFYQGYSVDEISKSLDKMVCVVQKAVVTMNNQMEISQSARVLIRRQYRVIGPDYGVLAQLTQHDRYSVRRCVNTTPSIWQTVNKGDDLKLTRYQKVWGSTEHVALMELVQKYKDEKRNINWIEISKEMERSHTSCRAMYYKRLSRHKHGKFSFEEDDLLIKHLPECIDDLNRYNQYLPQERTKKELAIRLSRLFNPKSPVYAQTLGLLEKYEISNDVVEKILKDQKL